MQRDVTASGESCVVSITEKVADQKGVDPGELPPLYEAVAPTQLERCVESSTGPLTVEFSYCGCTVVVDGEGRVEITDADRIARQDAREHRV